jgi:hypothetical protein
MTRKKQSTEKKEARAAYKKALSNWKMTDPELKQGSKNAMFAKIAEAARKHTNFGSLIIRMN